MYDLKTPARQIYLPLLVMLLLTVLVGATAFQLSDNWQKLSTSVSRHMVQTMLLSNIRWGLYQVKTDLPNDEGMARQRWEVVKTQVGILQGDNIPSEVITLLRSFMANDRNIHNIDYILRSEALNLQLEEVQADLDNLQNYARFVLTSVTVSMIVLGLVLTGITAHDLDHRQPQTRLP